MSDLVLYAIPAFIALMLVELVWARAHRADPAIAGYEPRDTAASLAMGLGNVGISAITKLGTAAAFAWLYEHRIASIGDAWWAWLVLLVAEDHCYYWFHRASHEVRLLWTAHINHHSSQHYNLSTALRQSWLTPITGPVFWMPLALVGFTPMMIFTAQAWSLLYQFWIHTESIRTLGPLEAVMNTPSHHRVHHGANVAYLDKNHAGIFIIWDRLYGTFAREVEPVRYGLTTNIHTFNPVRIAFHELAALARDMRDAPSLGVAIQHAIRPPGWSHDGRTLTSRQLQAQAAAPPA